MNQDLEIILHLKFIIGFWWAAHNNLPANAETGIQSPNPEIPGAAGL